MVGGWWLWWLGLSVVAVIGGVRGANVTYDGRSLIVDGQRKLLFSGSIHYPRSTPDMWHALISKAKDGGLDVIDTYVFWSFHETQPGKYDFSGRRDMVRFIKAVQAQGLYVCLRIGPFVESEWSYGGFPFWLHDIPGIVFRSDNEPFKIYMQNFTTKIVTMMKLEKLYASQGGPIILSQIENEYQMVEAAFHENGPSYVRWAAAMAVGLQTGVPWAMCKQDDAPDPVINACNGMMCGETFAGPNSPNKPAIWTENWTHVYDTYGKATRVRSPEDIAYHTALFIARKNGCYINYYMYHGGTNFGRSTSAFVLTSYYDQAPIDEYGFTRQPKFGHLKGLHTAVKLSSHTILYGAKTNFSLGALQEAYVFHGDSEVCAAFLVNTDGGNNATVLFMNSTYRLPPKSISILPDCKTVAYNTAQVVAQFNTRSTQPAVTLNSRDAWQEWSEIVPSFNDTSVRSNLLLEQMNTTKDASDYLWYTASYRQLNDSEALLTVRSLGHVLHVFVNGLFIGSMHGSLANKTFILNVRVPLRSGVNNISLLSTMVGLPDSGAYLERKTAGLKTVSIQVNQVLENLSNYSWGYQVGLTGERLQLYTNGGSNGVKWNGLNSSPKPLTWYKAKFDAPKGNDPVALNLGSMGKGEIWINGQSIGRYWISFYAPNGSPSQTWYHIPRSFLTSKDNKLVMFEEETGNPLGISVDTVSISKVCAHVFDSYPNRLKPQKGPTVQLTCPRPRNITKILFASYGTPLGDCQHYAVGSCHSSNSTAVVEKDCIGKRTCSIPQSSKKFGSDPCPGIPKSLLIEAQCQ